MTAREFLGDDNIKKLEGLGFSPLAIRDLARKEYETKKQSLIDRGINESVAAQGAYENMSDHEIEQMNDDVSRGWIRRGWDDTKKAVLETANAYSKFNDYGKDIENYLNKKISGDEKAKFEQKTKSSLSEYADKEIKRIDKADERWAQAHPGEWNVAGLAGGLVGGFIDPINFIPLGSSAKWGKKILYYAGTGAAAGGVSAYGGDRDIGEGVVAGAVGGAILGPLMEYGVSGISKLIAKRQANKVANEADAIEGAENSGFLDGNNNASGDSVVAQLKTAETMTAREFATKEVGLDEDTATNVLKEAMQGKEKSDWTDADTYADIAKFKNFEIQREYAKAYGEKIQATQASINNAREQSAIRYADTQKAINEYQKQGISPSAARELINAKFKPSVDEINYTRAYNDGSDVDTRLAGQGIFYALEKDIAAQAYTPEIYAARLKQRGFSDESVQAFTQAYVSKDINIAKDYANSKVADAYENKIQREVANEIRDRDEVGGGFVNEEAKNNELSDSVSDIGDNASRTGGRQASDEQILRQGGRNTSSASQTKRTAQSDEQMEQRPAFKTDGDTDATAASKQMVEEQGSGDNEIRGENFITKESPAPKSDLNVKISVDDWVRELGGINANKQIKADLTKLYEKHKELFTKPSDVFRLIKAVKENPTFFYNNNEPNTALIGKILDNGKLGKIGIQKEYDSEYLKLNHATYSSKADKENKRLLRRNENSHLVGSPTPTQLTLGKATEPTADGAKALLDENSKRAGGKDAHIPLHTDTKPAGATGANARSSADESIIPQKDKNTKTINANSHIASGLVGGTLNSIDEDGNFNPNRFAAGFLAGLAGSKAVAITTRKMTPQLYNEILGIAKKMPQMAKDNPKLLGKLYQNAKDVSLNSFAGEKAITANVGKLDQAKAMLEKGADEVEIWQKTGWFKDEIDGKWKFEINSRGGELKPNPPSNTVLYNILNDEKLYEAYPELQLYKVEVAGEYNPMALKALGSADGGFIPSQKTFIINEKASDFKSTLYHEIQHAIQEIEGFSPGASSKNGKYWLAGGEVEARNVQKRMNDVSYDSFKNSTSMEFFPYKEEAQLQRMAGDKEYTQYHKLSKKYSDYLNDKGDGLSAQEEARVMELFEKIKGRLGFAEDDYKKGYELYLKENAEYQKHPLHTLDAPRGERVNIGRGDLNLSKELEKKYILKDGSINEAAIRKEAEPFIEREYSLENFKAEFLNGKVDTPIGEVDISSSQFQKLERKGREKYLGLIKPTLERPAFVVDFEDTTFFFKPFRDKDGVVKFASVIKERDGGLDVISNYPMKNRKFELITREGKVRYVQGSVVVRPLEHSLDDTVRSSGGLKPIEHSSDGKGIIQQNEEKIYHSRNIEEIKQEHPNVEKELDESIAAMRKESFNDSNFKDGLIGKFDTKEIATQQLGKSVNLSNKQLATLKNDIKNADFKVINESKIYFDKVGKDGDKKRFFVDIAEDGSLRVDAYAKSQVDNIPVKQSALEELAGVGDAARLKNMSFEVKAAYRNELDPIKKEAILKTAELNKLKKAAQSGDKVAVAKFEEFKAKNLDKNGNIKDGLRLC